MIANLEQIKDLRDRWHASASVRRSQFELDPIASVLAACAQELAAVLDAGTARPMTPAVFAAQAGVSPQAVTAWCRGGRLEAYRQGGRWLIPAGAKLTPEVC